VKSGKVFATATEDMDALTFGSNILLRHMTFSEARKMPIQEFHLDKVLAGLELNQEQVETYDFNRAYLINLFSSSTSAFCWGVTTATQSRVLVQRELLS
jgi:XPG I-region